ncbi:hypothetical protein [Trichocoleus sp. FACHB-262]|uniref:hypothetical protein n=1 Tax=Trichocoleus sp. FACHB-262 TaxID=2692869 RepID=UPI0016864AC8|nr:hypothetical protein [Trichocoleus sp. FACHB-262]MBD2123954.1 hypothetical protein [Trichocoleus sp. FACHB-262]
MFSPSWLDLSGLSGNSSFFVGWGCRFCRVGHRVTCRAVPDSPFYPLCGFVG